MLEWLKAILGDGYTEEIDRKISAEIGRGFVSKSDFNAVNEAKKALEKTHQAEIAQLKLDSAIDAALTAAGAKNLKTVRALLDLKKVKQGEDGRLDGLEEQLEAVQRSDGYLFAEKQQQNGSTHGFKGFQPGASSDGVPDPEQGGFEARLALARRDNNQMEVIRIKQEAAANGVVLL